MTHVKAHVEAKQHEQCSCIATKKVISCESISKHSNTGGDSGCVVAKQGGWTGVLVSIAGFLLFTLGSMNHHTTSEGSRATWAPTLGCAAIAAFLAQRFYQKAIAGVAGETLHHQACALLTSLPSPVVSSNACQTKIRLAKRHTCVCCCHCDISCTQIYQKAIAGVADEALGTVLPSKCRATLMCLTHLTFVMLRHTSRTD